MEEGTADGMTAAYLHGYDGLAGYLGVSVKTARALDGRINFPKCPLPGVVRDVVLFRIAEIDEAIDRIRREKSQVSDPVMRPAGRGTRFFDVKAAAAEILNGS